MREEALAAELTEYFFQEDSFVGDSEIAFVVNGKLMIHI